MSKELTPLQALNKPICIEYTENSANDKLCYRRYQVDIIEKALKKLEKPKEIVGTTTVDKALEQFLIDSCPEVAKKLKALEIIKEKKWLVEDILNTFIEDKEKYNLVKEMLE